MADVWVGLNRFWNSFGWAAYDEQTYFDEDDLPSFPHITYEAGDGAWEHETFLTAHLWDKSPDWKTLKQKAAEIKEYIGLGGVKVNVDGGQLWIKIPVGMTFSQPIDSGSENENIKRILINMTVEYLTV